jgi:tetratricopeptide (TPR) repeat protein
MKKALIALLFVLCHSISGAAINPKFGLELKGGYGLISPADFNADYTGVFKNGFSIPDTIVGTELSDSFYGSLHLDWFLSGNFALFFRSDYIYLENSDKLVPDGTETEVIDSHVTVSAAYFGLGGKAFATLSDYFVPYVSVDAGLFAHFGTFWEVWADPANTAGVTVDSLNQYSIVDITDPFFGAHAELGFNILFGSWGFNAGGGYRYAPAVLTYPELGIFAQTEPDGTKTFKASTLDLSGIYFGGGLTFFFGMEPQAAASKPGAQKQAEETKSPGDLLAEKYEKYGDTFYDKGNYDYASRYYMGAVKASTNVDPLIYKKIGFTYLKLKNKKKALYYIELYVKYTPSDTKMAEWLEKYK